MAAIASARQAIAKAAPDPGVRAEGEAYIARVATSCLNDAFLAHMLTEGGLGTALPTRGGPNPDYRMRHAAIDPSGRYRIEGRLNGSERVGIGLYSFGAGGSAEISDYAAFDRGSAGPAGVFALDIAADSDGPGTLTIRPGARAVLARILHLDPASEPAHLRLVGGEPIRDLTLAGGSTDAALTRAAQALSNAIVQFLEWSAITSTNPNRFGTVPEGLTQTVQGDPDTLYFLGYYDLGEEEWLEVVVPAGLPGYWSIHAYNHWCESLPGAGIHNRNAAPGASGETLIAIGPRTPEEVPNRIDTLGRRKGVLICRIIGATCDSPPGTSLRSFV